MAINKGIIQPSGKLGQSIFINKGGRNFVKTKPTSVNLSEASRKSATDFGEASRNASKIRKAFAPFVVAYGNQDLINRLNKKMIEAFKAIPTAMAGTRNFGDSHVKLLKNFRFNSSRTINDLWSSSPSIELKPEGLTIQLSGTDFSRSTKATHIVLQLMVANLDLNGETNEIIKAKDLVVQVGQHLRPVRLTISSTLSGNRVLLVALGIHYLINGSKIINKRLYGCDICYAERIKDGQIIDFLIEEQAIPDRLVATDEEIGWEEI